MVYKRRKFVTWTFSTISSIATYLPVLGGILEPMIWPLLISSPFLYHLLYWWWDPIAQYFSLQYMFITSYISQTQWVNQLAPIVICIGIIPLLGGLAQVVYTRVREEGLVTKGLYRYVRHPQHLGIAIMSFGFLMLNRCGIRVGDIIAWTLVVFIYVLQGDSEEEVLEKEFGESYKEYKRKVPYMIPVLPSTYERFPKILPEYGWKRKLSFILIYIFVLALTIWLITLLPTFHLR